MGDLLQDDAGVLKERNSRGEKFRYELATINSQPPDAPIEIYLVSHNAKEQAGSVRSEVAVLREKSAEDQVFALIYETRLEEAFECFKLREPKGPMYRQKEIL